MMMCNKHYRYAEHLVLRSKLLRQAIACKQTADILHICEKTSFSLQQTVWIVYLIITITIHWISIEASSE